MGLPDFPLEFQPVCFLRDNPRSAANLGGRLTMFYNDRVMFTAQELPLSSPRHSVYQECTRKVTSTVDVCLPRVKVVDPSLSKQSPLSCVISVMSFPLRLVGCYPHAVWCRFTSPMNRMGSSRSLRKALSLLFRSSSRGFGIYAFTGNGNWESNVYRHDRKIARFIYSHERYIF